MSEPAKPSGQDAPAPSARRRPLLRSLGCLLQALGLLFLLLLLAAGAGFGLFLHWADGGFTPREGQALRLEVQPGDSLRRIAARAEAAGLAAPPEALIALAYWTGSQRQLKPGTYRFEPGTSPRSLLEALRRGPAVQEIQVTLPEGWNADRMAAALEKAGAIDSAQAFLDATRDPELLREHGIDAENAEGYLFPDTYRFLPRTPGAQAVRRLLNRFDAVIGQLRLQPGINSPHAQPLTFHQSVVLASIIQREARRTDEMPRIASVFHNRLRKNMRLESCATVRFATGNWSGPLRKSELDTDSPYNTYRRRGLPPGPVANPGREALDAAFRPAQSEDLFFVYRGDGRHAFSKTLSEHEKARRQYRDAWTFSAAEEEPQAPQVP